jgi:hypothetical protein
VESGLKSKAQFRLTLLRLHRSIGAPRLTKILATDYVAERESERLGAGDSSILGFGFP